MHQVSARHKIITCTGPDATSFLEGQITCKVADLAPNQWRWAAHCNAKGRMHSLLQVVRLSDELIYLVATADNAEYACAQLAKYAVFSKVTLVVSELSTIGLIGYDTAQPGDVSQYGDGLCLAMDNHCALLINAQQAQLAVDTDDRLWQQAWIESGMPWFNDSLQGELIPQYIDLDLLNGIAFNKGCYQGQEVIARLHFKGKSKKVRALSSAKSSKLVDNEGRKRSILLNIGNKESDRGSPSLYLLDGREHDQLLDEDGTPANLTIISPIRA